MAMTLLFVCHSLAFVSWSAAVDQPKTECGDVSTLEFEVHLNLCISIPG